jgi:hypothetical protein
MSHLALYTDLLKDLSDACPSFNASSVEEVELLEPWPDMTTQEFAVLQLAKSFLKKFEDRTSTDCDKAALDTFLQSNMRCKDWSLDVSTMEDELLVGLFEQEIHRFFNPSLMNPLFDTYNEILCFMDTGPGAAVHARGNDFYTKLFSSKLSSTSKALYRCYRNYISRFPAWSEGEDLRLDHYGEVDIVEGNRLSFVPKNDKTSRVICIEPSLNVLFQKGICEILTRRINRYFGIDLSNQPDINRDMAKSGSVGDHLSTIDLSAASDSVSIGMIRKFLPRSICSWLEITRSPFVNLPNGECHELHMISSMGNAFTFPLETIIFSCIVSACYQAGGIPLRKNKVSKKLGTLSPGNFAVFGDDIIVDSRVYRKVIRLLQLLGFQANADKSFKEGPFRESCGGDFFNGSPVRGIYIKSLKQPQNRYVAINRLNEWSAQHNIMLRRTVRRLLKTVRYIPIPLYENDDAGVKVPYSLLDMSKLGHQQGNILYRRWCTEPKRIRLGDGVITTPRKAKSRMYNPGGLLTAALRGDVRNYTIGIRLGPARYRTKEAISPYWDYMPTVAGACTSDYRRRLVSAIWLNNLS